MSNRRITEFPAIQGSEIVDQDVLTLVHVFEVDPTLRNKKITFEQFKDYLNTYYASTSGATFSGNVAISGNLTVSGLGSFGTIFSSGLSTFSGIVVQNNAVISGTVSGTTITGTNLQGVNVNATNVTTTTATGTTALFTSGQYQSLSGATITGGQGSFTSGTFVNLSGTTITGTTVAATTGTFQTLSTPVLNVSGNLSVASGLTVTGTAQFAAGVQVTGTLSGTTVTGTTARFSTVSGVSGVFTTNLSGATITGDTVLVSNITGVSGVFTTRVSGATVTGNTGAFGNVSGISGVFTQVLSGQTITGNVGNFETITGVSGVFTNLSGGTVTGTVINAGTVTSVTGNFSRVSGTTVTGNVGQFTTVTGATVIGTTSVSGATVTGNAGQFTTVTGITVVGTTSISGATVTGNTVLATNLTGQVGTFTTSISGATITGNTISSTSGIFQNLSGAVISGGTVQAGVVSAVSGIFTNIVFVNTVISGNLVVLGTGIFSTGGVISSGTISGGTVTSPSGIFTYLSGTTVTGTTANFASGNFTNISGGVYTITSGVFASGTAANPSISFVDDSNTGIYASAADQVSITTSGTERLRVDAAGQIEAVSLGSASAPTYSFTTDPNTGIYSPGADQLAISTGGSGRLFINSSGNAGVGTSTPNVTGFGGATVLTVSNTASSVNTGVVEIQGGPTGNGLLSFLSGAQRQAMLTNTPDGQLQFWTGGASISEKLRITSAGLVGVGVSAPGASLDLNGDELRVYNRAVSGTARVRVRGYDNNSASYLSFDTGGVIRSEIVKPSSSSNLQFRTYSTGSASGGYEFYVSNGSAEIEAMRLDTAGRLAIGTTVPQALLHLEQSSPADGRLVRIFSTGAGGGFLGVKSSGNTFIDANTSTTALEFRTQDTERARIDSSGRLLVGTSSTSTICRSIFQGRSDGGNNAIVKLAFNSSTVAADNNLGNIEFTDSGHTAAASIVATRDGGTWTSGSSQPTRLAFSTTADGASSPTERLRIDSAGQIEANSLGTAAAPVWTFLSDPNTGIYSPGADQLAITTAGTQKFTIDSLDGNPIIDNQFPTTAPTLDLAFALTKQLDPRITFSRSSSGTYFDANGVLQSAATNVARFDHNPTTGESLGLLVEEARTNLFTYSEQLDNAAWTKVGTTVTANATTALDGTMAADKVIPDNGGTGGNIRRTGLSTNGVVSFYAKPAGFDFIGGEANVSGGYPTFRANLLTGECQSSSGSLVISSQNAGNGWWRFSLVGNFGTNAFIIAPRNDYAYGYTGVVGADGVKGIFLWGAQLEAGSFPTSYIPTIASTVTRAADVAQITGTNFSAFHRPEVGTIFTQCLAPPLPTADGRSIWQLDRPSTTGGWTHGVIYSRRSGGVYEIRGGASDGEATLTVSDSPGALVKTVYAYDATSQKIGVNGVMGGQLNNGQGTNIDVLRIGWASAFGGYSSHANVPIARLTYWPTRLPDATLQTITK